MELLSAESVLAAEDREVTAVRVPEWNGLVGVRVMSVGDRETFERAAGAKDPQGLMVLLVSLAACDSQGRPLFSPEQVARLAEKSSKALYRVFRAATALNKIDAGDVDAAEGESDATRSGS